MNPRKKHPNSLCAAVSVARDPYAWPGGYPRYLVMEDGGTLCPACVKKELRLIIRATRDRDGSGWHSAGSGINWEDPALFCDHCGRRIESAYADDES